MIYMYLFIIRFSLVTFSCSSLGSKNVHISKNLYRTNDSKHYNYSTD